MGFASCCVLSFERPDFLEVAIATLGVGAGAPHELIIHDDGSRDERVHERLDVFRRMGATVIASPPGHNQGQGVALNRMFAMAKGDPIIKLDQDLIFQDGWLRAVNAVLAKAPTEGALLPVFRGGRVVAHTLVDDDLAPMLSESVWRLQANGFVVRTAGKTSIHYLHKIVAATTIEGSPATKSRKSQHADHINRVRLDNRRANLRVLTQAENAQNISSVGKTSAYRGVSWSAADRRWRAQSGVNSHRQFLGCFDTELEAAERCEAFRREHMPFATPDPLLFDGAPPPIGLLGLYRYHHEPVDCAKTILGRADGWERHSHICGCAFAMPRVAWEAMGRFEEHSDSFSEDFRAQKWIHESGLWCCALPSESLVENQGFGLGPSTVVVAEGQVRKIHKGPVVLS